MNKAYKEVLCTLNVMRVDIATETANRRVKALTTNDISILIQRWKKTLQEFYLALKLTLFNKQIC